MIDLVLTDETLNLGFSRLYKVEIIKLKSKTDLKKLGDEINIIEGGNLNREILENRKIDVLLSPEKGKKNDFIHHRNSGLNHVLCKLAQKNKIMIGFNFNDVLKSSKEERGILLGRMMQNVNLCRKYKLGMILGSFANDKYEMRNSKDLLSFARCIGMTPGEAKNSLNNFEKILKEKEFKEGIRIVK